MSGDVLVFANLVKIVNFISPPLYYVDSAEIELGKVIVVKSNSYIPEFIVVHPDDLDRMKAEIPSRKFIHLRDYPSEVLKEDLNKVVTQTLIEQGWLKQ